MRGKRILRSVALRLQLSLYLPLSWNGKNHLIKRDLNTRGSQTKLDNMIPLCETCDNRTLSLGFWYGDENRWPNLQELTARNKRIGGKTPFLEIAMAQAPGVQNLLGDGYRLYVTMKHRHPYMPKP